MFTYVRTYVLQWLAGLAWLAGWRSMASTDSAREIRLNSRGTDVCDEIHASATSGRDRRDVFFALVIHTRDGHEAISRRCLPFDG